uniref:glucuronosyltransferase n=1 Tax=Ditylenchus dipsaci TaxID=166011 RepID=A0A915D7N2_9BILA
MIEAICFILFLPSYHTNEFASLWPFILLVVLCDYSNGYKILVYNPKFAGHDVVVYQPVLNDNISFSGTKNKSVRYYVMPRKEDYVPNSLWKTTRNAVEKRLVGKNIRDDGCYDQNQEGFLQNRAERHRELGECCFKPLRYLHSRAANDSFLCAWTSRINYRSDELSGENLKFLGYIPDYLFTKAMFDGEVESVIREKVPDFNMMDTIADSAFYFVNSEEHIDYAQPITHKIVYMGGLGKVQSVPLEQNYVDIFSSAKRGVILFSFGSVVQSNQMSPEIKKAFLDAFAEFPDINFVWKYEKDEDQVAKDYKNVFTGKWLPQNEFLDHPRLLAFISHAGMNSIIEAASKGVPMICMPQGNIVAAINNLLSNPSYKANAQLLSRMVKAKPMKSEERVVKYAEFAAEFGDTGTLQLQGKHLTFVQLHSLDVIFTLMVLLMAVIALMFWAVRKMIRWAKVKVKNNVANGDLKKKN